MRIYTGTPMKLRVAALRYCGPRLHPLWRGWPNSGLLPVTTELRIIRLRLSASFQCPGGSVRSQYVQSRGRCEWPEWLVTVTENTGPRQVTLGDYWKSFAA